MEKKICNICILTIHKGSIKNLQKTIDSVDSQSFAPIKHIILAKEICRYQINSLKKFNREFFINNKNDKSVFHGMNIVKKYSKEIPIIYLNSGDIFFNKNSLHDFNKLSIFLKFNYVLIFKTVLCVKDLYFDIKTNFFKDKNYLPHSSFLCKNNFFNKKINFDTKFKISADGIWMRKIISRSRSVKKILKKLVIQNLYGQSSLPSLKTLGWRFDENYLYGFKEFLKLLISKIVPLDIYFLIIYYRKYNFSKK
jgi:hypothetical protein